jgi:4-hydroxybenzoate polyprenyltransferase
MVLFPLIFFGVKIQSLGAAVLLVLFVFVESMITQIVLDMKDVKSDKSMGLLTLPAVVGVNKTFIALKVLPVLVSVFICFYIRVFSNPLLLVALVALNVLVNYLSIVLVRQRKVHGYILSASKFFLWFLLIFILK